MKIQYPDQTNVSESDFCYRSFGAYSTPPPPPPPQKLRHRLHPRALLAFFVILCALIGTAITPQTVYADSIRQWVCVPDFFAVTKLGEDKEIINGKELQRLLDGAEFQVISENGQPLQFVKRPFSSDLLNFLKSSTELFKPIQPEQEYQFSNLPSPLNYYQQALPSEPFYQKGWIRDAVYESNLNVCFDGVTPSDSSFTNTLVATKEAPLIIGAFPTKASAIHYSIEEGQLDFYIKLEETLTLKETKAPAGYELSTETPSFQVNAYVWGYIINYSEEDAEREFLDMCTGLYENITPVRLEPGTEECDIFFSELNDIADNMNSTPNTLSVQMTDPIKRVDIPVEKKWEGFGEALEPVNVVLLKNGAITDKILELNKENNWKGVFKDLRVRDKEATEDNVYTIKEQGEDNGKVILNGDEYQVAISGDMSTGFTITNTHITEETPTPSTPPTVPDKPVVPTTQNQSAVPTTVTKLPKTGDNGMSYVYSTTMLGVVALLIVFRWKLKHEA